MDFHDDEIGNFGLPPLIRKTCKKKSILSKTNAAGVAKTTVAKKVGKKKTYDVNQLLCGPKTGVKRNIFDHSVEQLDRNYYLSSDDDDDDDGIALSDLVKRAPAQKITDNGRLSNRTNLITASQMKNGTMQQQPSRPKSRTSEDQTNENSSGETHQRKKLKKQSYLHSFLRNDRQISSNRQSSSSASSSSHCSGNDTTGKKLAAESVDSLVVDQSNEHHDVSEKVATNCEDSAADEIVESDDGDLDSSSGITPTKNEREDSKHPTRFGIHSLILGHALPIMHPEEYHRAASDTDSSVGTRPDQQTNNHTNRNILSHILQRTYCHKSSPSSTNLLTRYVHSNTNQQSTECIQLSSSTSNNSNSEICAMAFDTMGILLAAGDSRGKIDIFDFDEVYAADVKKRNEWARHCYEHQVASASNDDDANKDDDSISNVQEDCIPTTGGQVDNEEEGEGKDTENGEDDIAEKNSDDIPIQPLPPHKLNPVLSFQCQFVQGDATRNNNYLNSANRPRISGVYWNPCNQDHLAVSFGNKPEIHLYDVASSKSPPPCLRVGASFTSQSGHIVRTQQQRSEGVMSMRFVHSPDKDDGRISSRGRKVGTLILTGGRYGTVRLWSISPTKQTSKRRRSCCISEMNAKCIWSIPVLGSKGDSISDMLILPAMSTTKAAAKPLVLLSGGSSSTLVLLDTNRCTRKAFSTAITPTVVASWNLHRLASHELASRDSKAVLPDRRWISVKNMRLIEYKHLSNECGSWWCKISIITNAGWVFVAELCSPNNTPRLSVQIVHYTPQIQCFDSSNNRLLGGLANKFSLPNAPVPSSDCIRMASSNMIWLADVKGMKYTMPSKDKYVLCEDFGSLEVMHEMDGRPGTPFSSSDNSAILVNLDGSNQSPVFSEASQNLVCRLSLMKEGGAAVVLAIHPSGDWMVVSCGKDSSSALKLIRLRRVHSYK